MSSVLSMEFLRSATLGSIEEDKPIAASQATLSGFVPPRSTHKQTGRADDGPATTALTRSVSSHSPPRTARRSKAGRTASLFAAYAYTSSRRGKDEEDEEEGEAERMQREEEEDERDEQSEADGSATTRRARVTAAASRAEEEDDEMEEEEEEAEEERLADVDRRRPRLNNAPFYSNDAEEEEDDTTHSRLLMHAYSLPLRPYRQQQPLEDEPPPVPPDDLGILTWPDLPSTTFADATTSLSQPLHLRLSSSPTLSQSPSPPPSPPPAPASRAVFSRYFPSSSSAVLSDEEVTARCQAARSGRDEVVLDEDEDEDDSCVLLDDDKENVDTANLRPLSQLDGELGRHRGVMSRPTTDCTRTASTTSPPALLLFGNKTVETQSDRRRCCTHRSGRTVGKMQLSRTPPLRLACRRPCSHRTGSSPSLHTPLRPPPASRSRPLLAPAASVTCASHCVRCDQCVRAVARTARWTAWQLSTEASKRSSMHSTCRSQLLLHRA